MTINRTRSFKTLLVGIAIVASGVSLAYAEQRTWTGRNGKQLTAELVLDEGDHILLRDSEGKKYRTKTSNLSAADIEFLKSIREPRQVVMPPTQQPQEGKPSAQRKPPGSNQTPLDLESLYEVVSIQDLSYENVGRKVYRVRVSQELSNEELKAISRKIVRQVISKEKIKAIRIFYFLPDSDTNGPFTAGKATWAPGGDWGSASTNSSAKLVVEAGSVLGTIPKEEVVDMPLAKKKQIFMQIVRYQDKGMNSDKAHTAAAQYFGISVDQAKKISLEGSIRGWEFP